MTRSISPGTSATSAVVVLVAEVHDAEVWLERFNG